MKIFNIKQIQKVINLDKELAALVKNQKQAFIDFSARGYEVPLPIQLSFPNNSGDCHIKAGFKEDGEVFVVKVASGFYKNLSIGLPSSDGILLVFSQKTGKLLSMLYDGGWLTTLRTAIAGIIAASVTPWEISNIGIIGTGALASLIQVLIKKQYSNVNICIWGRDLKKTHKIADGDTTICEQIHELLVQSDVVISTTAATAPIIKDGDISGKKHIIALGADDVHKQECDPELFKRCNKVIVDSSVQARQFGDSFHAIAAGFIAVEETMELGEVLQGGLGSDPELIITDLTGIAAQDVSMAEFVLHRLYQFPFFQ